MEGSPELQLLQQAYKALMSAVSVVSFAHQVLNLHSKAFPNLQGLSSGFTAIKIAKVSWFLSQAYAMTEASHQMTSNPLPKHGPHKPGTVGIAQGSVKVAILDNQNKPLGEGKVGEVCIRGPNVTRGYLNNPKANEEGFAGRLNGLNWWASVS